MPTHNIQRGDLYWIEWNPARGSEQAGWRPGLVVQTNVPNQLERYPLTIVAAVTTALKGYLSSARIDPSPTNGLSAPSEILCNQLQTVSKDRLCRFIGRLNSDDMANVGDKLRYMLALT